MIETISGQAYRVLADRTVATLQSGDVVASYGIDGGILDYARVRSTRADITATSRKRGLPFHRVRSVLVSVEALRPNGFHFLSYEGRDSLGRYSAALAMADGPKRYDTWLFDRDDRFTVYRPVAVTEQNGA
jgi:hypothetical protein